MRKQCHSSDLDQKKLEWRFREVEDTEQQVDDKDWTEEIQFLNDLVQAHWDLVLATHNI